MVLSIRRSHPFLYGAIMIVFGVCADSDKFTRLEVGVNATLPLTHDHLPQVKS